MKANALLALLLASHEVCPYIYQQGMKENAHVSTAIAGCTMQVYKGMAQQTSSYCMNGTIP
jgi:hypothetical protein